MNSSWKLSGGKPWPLTIVITVACVITAPISVRGQGVTDPGALLNTDRRLQDWLDRHPKIPADEKAPVEGGAEQTETHVAPGGPTFHLRIIEFGESAFLSTADLAAIAGRHEGHQIDLAGLYGVISEINAIYRARGIVTASAVLPPQDIDKGIVRIDLVEGRVGEVRVVGAQALKEDFVTRRVSLIPGEVVDPPALSKQITRFNRTHLAQTHALLEPGKDTGLTDIQLAVIEPKRNRFEVSFDNLGNDSTDERQLGFALLHYGLLGIDDRLSVRASASRGNITGNLAYNFPIDARGDRLGISYSRNAIDIVRGPFTSLGITGESQNVALSSTHPLFVDEWRLFSLNTELSAGTSTTQQSGIEVGRGETFKGTVGFTFSAALPSYTWWATANVALLGRHDRVLDDWASPVVFNGAAGMSVPLPNQFTGTAMVGWQYGTSPFLPADQLFQIGGPGTVRGYPTNTFGGDSGAYANVELEYAMPQVLEGFGIFAFADSGFIHSDSQPTQSLASSGGGVRWNRPDGLAGASLTVAFPFTTAVPDQDSVKVYGRLFYAFE